MKIDSDTQDKSRWKVVRTDTLADVVGDVVLADEATGECRVQINGETKEYSFGPGGMRIVGRGR